MSVLELTAINAVKLMRGGVISVTEYTEALIAQMKLKSHLNSFISWNESQLLDHAKKHDNHRATGGECGELFGLPIAVKDNIETLSYPTTGGTGALKNYRPKRNAPVLQKILSQGAMVLGKTNLHELAFGITSNNGIYGSVRNPYDPEKIAGGSSGGSAAAVAARICPFALGTDTGGSTRIPPALCGITGWRPTMGRYGSEGAIPLSHSRDTIGTMARSVEDIQLIDQVITGVKDQTPLEHLKGIKIGVSRDYFYSNLDPEVEKYTEKTLLILKDLGAELIEVNVEEIAALNEAISFPICLYEAILDIEKYLPQTGLNLTELIAGMGSNDVKETYQEIWSNPPLSKEEYQNCISHLRPKLLNSYEKYFRENGLSAMVLPTTKLTARPIGQQEVVINGVEIPIFPAYIHNTDPSSNAGIPGISIPIGLSDEGLPIGIEFDGPVGSDRKLMQIAALLQAAVEQIPAP